MMFYDAILTIPGNPKIFEMSLIFLVIAAITFSLSRYVKHEAPGGDKEE